MLRGVPRVGWLSRMPKMVMRVFSSAAAVFSISVPTVPGPSSPTGGAAGMGAGGSSLVSSSCHASSATVSSSEISGVALRLRNRVAHALT